LDLAYDPSDDVQYQIESKCKREEHCPTPDQLLPSNGATAALSGEQICGKSQNEYRRAQDIEHIANQFLEPKNSLHYPEFTG
jgi:hypothetical protein